MRKQFYCFVVALVATSLFFQTSIAQNTAPYWSLAGNSNSTLSSKLGTTGAVSLRIVTNNTDRIKILSTGNVGIGTSSPAQKLDVAGNINLAKGYGLYMENHRVLLVDSLQTNVFLGTKVGAKNTGISNTAAGSYALSSGNSGTYNTAFGYTALNYNTIGYSNTATGAFALSINNTGNQNTATGNYALYANSTGSNNTALGYGTLYYNTTGSQNTATGQGALSSNTTGDFNTASGSGALYANTTASYNVGVGFNALASNSSGIGNVAVGGYALSGLNGAYGNTAVGDNAGAGYYHGYYNTFIGSEANATTNSIYNSVALGNEAKVTASNQVRIGNAYTTSIGGATNWTNLSDGRVKRNIQENVPGLNFINKLKPITYNLDLDAVDKITGATNAKDKDGKTIAKQLTQTDIAARAAKQKVVYTGFVAQDVEKAAKELGFDFSGVDAAKSEKDLYGLRYTDFIMPLVKAVQELSQENDALKNRLEKLEATMNSKQDATTSAQKTKITGTNTASLAQNTPNPVTGNARIAYSLPKGTTQAQLRLTDNNGKTIRTLSLNTSGAVDINTAALSSGVYNYSLVIDSRTVATKRLTVAH